MNSAQQIIPQLQHLQVGDRIPMIAGEEVGPLVKELEPNRRMLWWDGKGEFTWEWLLEPLDDRTTRLLTRVQETYPPLWSRRMLYAVVASSGDSSWFASSAGDQGTSRAPGRRQPRAPDARRHPPRPRYPREGDAAPQLRGRDGRGRADGLRRLDGGGLGPLRRSLGTDRPELDSRRASRPRGRPSWPDTTGGAMTSQIG